MVVTTYMRGHKVYYSEKDAQWKYCDDDSSVDNERACSKCGHLPYAGGEDYCLGSLDYRDIAGACCGHGVPGEGYIMLKDGRTFRLREVSHVEHDDDEDVIDKTIKELSATIAESRDLYDKIYGQLIDVLPELPVAYGHQLIRFMINIAMIKECLSEAIDALDEFEK